MDSASGSRVTALTTPASGDGFPAIGTIVTFSKTIGETDIYLFAGISGDFSPNHVNEEYMHNTRYGHRIAHGVLSIALMSTASAKMMENTGRRRPSVSYGYDRIRFVKPVFIGDTLTVEYKVIEHIADKDEVRSQVTVTNQRKEVVTVATHILKFV